MDFQEINQEDQIMQFHDQLSSEHSSNVSTNKSKEQDMIPLLNNNYHEDINSKRGGNLYQRLNISSSFGNEQAGKSQFDNNVRQTDKTQKDCFKNNEDQQQQPECKLKFQFEYQEICECDFFVENQTTYRVSSSTSGQCHYSHSNNQEEGKEEQQKIGEIFNNEFTIVDLSFDYTLNKFLVTKENKKNEKEFKQEIRMLQQTKDSNITLDIVCVFENEQKFSQIAGKTNLGYLKQKASMGNSIFDTFYFILLAKLKKMHEIGIAHSDIKPSNIAISFENQPYFIDFGGAINLNDKEFQLYLNQYTPLFNLEIYFQNIGKSLFKPKIFTNRSDIELCDMTQLALTFLQIYSIKLTQIRLFNSKKYNELIKDLFEGDIGQTKGQYYRKSQITNRKLVLSSISSILHQADSTINVIGNYQKDQERSFTTQLIESTTQLNLLQDIIYSNKSGGIQVHSIDVYTILQIHFLDKKNYKLIFNFQKIRITPMPDLEAYKEIKTKYKIDEYFDNLINGKNKCLTNKDLLNLCAYLEAYQHQENKISIIVSSKLKWTLFLYRISMIKNSPTHVKLIYSGDLLTVIQGLNEYHLKFKPISYEICKDFVICHLQRDKEIKNLTNPLPIELIYNDRFTHFFKQNYIILKQKYKIASIKYNSRYSFDQKYNQKVAINITSNDMAYLMNEMDSNDGEQQPRLSILLERSLKGSELCCSQCLRINLRIKSSLQIQIEGFTCNILKNVQLTQQKNKIITIKISDYFFQDLEMWREIQRFLKANGNDGSEGRIIIQLVMINCSFSEEVSNIIDQIRSENNDCWTEDQIQYHGQKFESEDEFLKYTLYIEQKNENSSQCFQKGFQMIYLKRQQIIQCKQGDENSNREQSLQNNSQRKRKTKSPKVNPKLESDFDEQKMDNPEDIIIKKYYFQKPPPLSDLEKYCQLYPDLFCMKECNSLIGECKQKHIDMLIKDLLTNKSKYYKDIKLDHRALKRCFEFTLYNYNNLSIYCDSERTDMLNQLFKIYSIFYNKYYTSNDRNQPQYYTEHRINIFQKMSYPMFAITQNISYHKFDNKFRDMCLHLDRNQSNKLIGVFHLEQSISYILLVRYFVKIQKKPENSQGDAPINEGIRKIFLDDLNHLKDHSITKSKHFGLFENQFPLLFYFKKYQKMSFRLYLEEIEKIYPYNKAYDLKSCNYTEFILYEIYEGIKTIKPHYNLYFDLTGNNIQLTSFKQFLNKILLDRAVSQQFVFRIETNNIETVYIQLISDLSDEVEVYYDRKYGFITISFKESLLLSECGIKICLDLIWI